MTSPTSLALAPATAQLAALASGEVTSSELLDVFLARIAEHDAALNAVVTLDPEGARRAAAAADGARRAGEALGPLHGLPITVKDAIEVGGLRSTSGAPALAEHVPQRDALAVARLRAAGAVVFGKTNVPTWCADIQTFNALFGVTNNPWDPSRTPGGSSGGSAVAVSCGFTGFELGTDIGGSIRFPAHCCGIFGLKPTYGIVPQQGYLDHVGGGTIDADINVFGPLARSAGDLALALSVLAGPTERQQPGWLLDLPRDDAPRTPGRIGLWLDEPASPVSAEVRDLLTAAAARLQEDGWAVADEHPAVDFEQQAQLAQRMIGAAVSLSWEAAASPPNELSHRSWLLAQAERATLEARWRDWFGRYDALLCPVLGIPAFAHDTDRPLYLRTVPVDGQEVSQLSMISWLGLIGVMGLPSVVAPVGRTRDGLPVGIQIVTGWFQDYRAIAIAQRLEALCGGYHVPPGL